MHHFRRGSGGTTRYVYSRTQMRATVSICAAGESVVTTRPEPGHPDMAAHPGRDDGLRLDDLRLQAGHEGYDLATHWLRNGECIQHCRQAVHKAA